MLNKDSGTNYAYLHHLITLPLQHFPNGKKKRKKHNNHFQRMRLTNLKLQFYPPPRKRKKSKRAKKKKTTQESTIRPVLLHIFYQFVYMFLS